MPEKEVVVKKEMFKKKHALKGIKLLTLSTSIRFFGWGLGEAFIPIFFLLFSANFLETGFLASAYSIIFFLFIPISAYLADNIKAKNMILAAMIIYIFIGTGYYLAGVTGLVIFILLSRGLNGVSFSLDQLGRESYFMRHSPKNKASAVFGRFDFMVNFWWILAVLIGFTAVVMFNVKINELLFFIAPTSIISFLIVLGLREKKRRKKRVKFSIAKSYLKMFKEIKHFNKDLKLIAFLAFIFGILNSIIYFFVPISSYLEGNGLLSAALLALIYSIPLMFGKRFGKLADFEKGKIYFVGIISLVIILLTLALFRGYYIILLVIMLFSSAVFELINLTNKGTITRLSNLSHIGEIDGSINGISALGAVMGPLLFGLLTDIAGLSNAYFIIAGVTITSFFVFLKGKKHLKK